MGLANRGCGIGFLSNIDVLGLLQPASSGKGDLPYQKLNSWFPIFWPLFQGERQALLPTLESIFRQRESE